VNVSKAETGLGISLGLRYHFKRERRWKTSGDDHHENVSDEFPNGIE
jgi:hypothetical protein